VSLEEFDLYGGLAGAELPVEQYYLGRGITLSKTYAHLMAPFMMAATPNLGWIHGWSADKCEAMPRSGLREITSLRANEVKAE
jgi:hypothetical protein